MKKTKVKYVSDERMILLISILKDMKVIRFDKQFCDGIGLSAQNIYNIKKGTNHFTPEHIQNAVMNFEVNANWIFGIEENIFLDKKKAHYKGVFFSKN